MSVRNFLKALTVGVFLCAPCAAMAQRLGGGASPEISVWRVVLALAVSLTVGIAALYLVRGRAKNGKPLRIGSFLKLKTNEDHAMLRVIERQRLSAQTEIILLRCKDQEYLVMSGTAHTSLLANYPAAGQNRKTEPER